MTPAFPAGPDDITPLWLNEVLSGSGFPTIRNVELERLGEADSLTGFVFRVRLTFDGEADAARSVVVKLPAAPERRSARMRGWYAAEVRFYRQLAANIGLTVPRAFHAQIDEATADYVLVLEDFPELTPGENVRGATPAQARVVMRMMAGLHAQWWERAELRGYDFLGDDGGEWVEGIAALLPDRVPVFLDHFGDAIGPADRAIYERLPSAFATAVEPLSRPPLTLIHRDFSIKNTLVGGSRDAPQFVVIDWQRCSVGRGVRDVSFFFENSVHGGWSEKFELLLLYHQALGEHGVRNYDFDQLKDDHRRSALCDMAQGVVMWTTERSPQAESVIRNQLRGIADAAEQLKLREVLSA